MTTTDSAAAKHPSMGTTDDGKRVRAAVHTTTAVSEEKGESEESAKLLRDTEPSSQTVETKAAQRKVRTDTVPKSSKFKLESVRVVSAFLRCAVDEVVTDESDSEVSITRQSESGSHKDLEPMEESSGNSQAIGSGTHSHSHSGELDSGVVADSEADSETERKGKELPAESDESSSSRMPMASVSTADEQSASGQHSASDLSSLTVVSSLHATEVLDTDQMMDSTVLKKEAASDSEHRSEEHSRDRDTEEETEEKAEALADLRPEDLGTAKDKDTITTTVARHMGDADIIHEAEEEMQAVAELKAADSSKKEKEAAARRLLSFDAQYKVVVNGLDPGWVLHKRYSQFEALHCSLLTNPRYKRIKDGLPSLPPKHFKWLTDHTARDFLEKRRALLDSYCQRLLSHLVVGDSQEVFNFFNSDRVVPSLSTASASKLWIVAQMGSDSSVMSSLMPKVEGTFEDGIGHSLDSPPPTSAAADAVGAIGSGSKRRKSGTAESEDKCEVTGIAMRSTRVMADHVLYQMKVENEHLSEQFKAWTLMKRYSSFFEFNQTLLNEEHLASIGLEPRKIKADITTGTGELFPILPPRRSKYLYDHKDKDFIETRRVLLENYMQRLLEIPEIARSTVFLKFVGVDV